jgi:hypothetical protein
LVERIYLGASAKRFLVPRYTNELHWLDSEVLGITFLFSPFDLVVDDLYRKSGIALQFAA